MVAISKQKKKSSRYPQNDWYSYYAGYSDEFVYEYLKKYAKKNSVILDPWNGTGTTTLCCFMLGIECIGIDLNPVMNVVAGAKCFQPTKEFSEKFERALVANRKKCSYVKDPLNVWFTEDTVSVIRSIQQSICKAFNIDKRGRDGVIDTATLSCEAAYALFLQLLGIRDYSHSFIGSNPTWIKKRNIEKVSISEESWIKTIKEHELEIRKNYSKTDNQLKPRIIVGDSKKIPLPDSSVNMVLTSPPYCTRIDYAIYTQLELSLLGVQNSEIKSLRNHMIGSPTVHKDVLKEEVPNELKLCNRLLHEIGSHDSKAAQTYYFKTYKQYILEMQASLKEISRVLVNDGIAVLVVQDSWFKNVYVDVPKMVLEIAMQFGLQGDIQYNPVKQNMAYINTKSRKYKKDKTTSEAIIRMKKGEICIF